MPDGNADQVRRVAEQIADAAIIRFASVHPQLGSGQSVGSIPAVLKWLAGIGAVLLTAAIVGTVSWLVWGLSDVQVSIARMDERLKIQAE